VPHIQQHLSFPGISWQILFSNAQADAKA